MKIIKMGNQTPKEKVKTCHNCKTVFSFTNQDINPDQRDGDYVICPVCKTFINVK